MNDEESRKMNLIHFLYENGIIEPKPEIKENNKSDSKEVTVFLASGKTLHFTNVKSCEEMDERSEDDEIIYLELVINYHGKTTDKDRIARFGLLNDNVIGYAVDEDI